MGGTRTYTDGQLRIAVASSSSWRGVLRHLGLKATSSSTIRSVRSRADLLEIDHRHFRGQRRWTETQLASAIAESNTWTEVARSLGLTGGSAISTLRGHALRLGLPTGHVSGTSPKAGSNSSPIGKKNLAKAATMVAAAWFMLHGQDVSWPLEPCRYDLLVDGPAGLRRVQVKSTQSVRPQTRQAFLSTTRRQRHQYDPDEIDDFFIVDGDLRLYLIPFAVAGGLHVISLNAYEAFFVGTLGVPS